MTLLELKNTEQEKYPEIKVCMWHTQNCSEICYVDSNERCVSVFYDEELTKVLDVRYKDDYYGRGNGQPVKDLRLIPEGLKEVVQQLAGYNAREQER